MSVVNTGSIADGIFNSISPMPNNVSGVLYNTVQEKIYVVEQYTGDSIGSVVAEKYQSCVEHLALGHILRIMSVQNMGVSQVSIGEMTVDNKNLLEAAKMFEEDGNQKLKWLSKGIKFYKARG